MANCYDFTAVQSYTIGKGVLKELKRLTFGFGTRYLILVEDRHFTDQMRERIIESLTLPVAETVTAADNPVGRAAGLMNNLPKPDADAASVEYQFYALSGKPCSYENVQTVGGEIAAYGPDVVVAVGGSKCLDIARAATHYVALYRRPKLVLCPTVAASNASATGMSVLYNEENTQMVDFWNLAVMPECVIVDTEIIVNSPVETLVAGIGDQLSSSLEALHTLKKIGAYDTCDRFCIAHHETVIEVLKKYACRAVADMRRRAVTPEFEWVCHAITRYTGPELAVATSFLSHILDEALIEFPAVRRRMHGTVVGYGVLPEMVAFGTPEEIYEYVDLFRALGIPVNLAELGLGECTYEDILGACQKASNKIMASRAIHPWTPEELAEAVMTADRLVGAYLKTIQSGGKEKNEAIV